MGARRMEVNGFVWPDGDVACRAVVFNSVGDMLPALDLCEGRDVAVQAGGNCGVWAAWLADRFNTVVTFEPDPTNFACLRQNVPGNVIPYEAALGAKHDLTDMVRDRKNCGAHYLKPGSGPIAVHPLDALSLRACDYLCLDVEGYEMLALIGAEETIRAHHPVIQIEDKGLSEKFGYAKGDAEKWLRRFGYKVRRRVARDVILA